MKLAWLLLAILAAGCVQTPEESVEGAAIDPIEEDVPVEPFAAEGTVWLPPSNSGERVETLLPFPVNATGMTLLAHATLGSQYGPLALPVTMADIVVELRAPDGTVLAEGVLRMGAPEAELTAEATQTGEHVLAILSYGGSDGAANGDHVDWTIEASLS